MIDSLILQSGKNPEHNRELFHTADIMQRKAKDPWQYCKHYWCHQAVVQILSDYFPYWSVYWLIDRYRAAWTIVSALQREWPNLGSNPRFKHEWQNASILFCPLKWMNRDAEVKRKQAVDSPTADGPFQSTGQVVTCWERTQNIDNILRLQQRSPTLYYQQWNVRPTAGPLSLFPFPFSVLTLASPLHGVPPLWILLLPHHSSVFSSHLNGGPHRCIYTSRPYMERGFGSGSKQCWAAHYKQPLIGTSTADRCYDSLYDYRPLLTTEAELSQGDLWV